MVNDSRFGLTSSVWTTNKQRGLDVCKELNTGTVFVNRCDFVDPFLPWSGRKDSGKGISLSGHGFGALTRTKSYNGRI